MATISVLDFPIELWEKIFLLLSPEDVLKLRLVNKHLYRLASSESLWQKVLELDMKTWTVISHSHNPLVGSSRPAIDIYRICRPRRSELTLPPSAMRNASLFMSFFGGIKAIIGSWAQLETPRIAILGPGIESSRTSSIVNQLLGLSTDSQLPTATKHIEFLPPSTEGFSGSLVELIPTGQRFHMHILYTKFKSSREKQSDFADRIEQSPFFTTVGDVVVVKEKVKELFSTLSGVIYVIDSTNPNGKVPPSADQELIMLSRCAHPAAPLLVLAAYGSKVGDNVGQITPAMTVSLLNLCAMARPWQVTAVEVLKGSAELVVPVNWLGSSASNTK